MNPLGPFNVNPWDILLGAAGDLRALVTLIAQREARESPEGRTAGPNEIGLGNSGTAREVTAENTRDNPVQVAKINLRNIKPGGCEGLASVHVFVEDVTPIPVGGTPANGNLMLEVVWQSGIGGGVTSIDITRGAFFTVGGSSSIELRAFWQSSITGQPLSLFATKRVEATVHWLGSVNPKPVKVTLPSFDLDSSAPTAWQAIPLQASTMQLQSTEFAALVNATAEFATRNDPATIKYRVVSPYANAPIRIEHGVEFVRFTTTDPNPNQVIFPSFEVWL